MGRRRRYYLPGTPFHITARVALRYPLFENAGVRTAICSYIRDAVTRSDARVLAFCVMPNHVHLIAVQGVAPLQQLMQPILRRTALCVQRRYGLDGRVFGRRFFSKPCLDPEYLRSMIVYTHLNPVRAGIVSHPDLYQWSSHACYAGTEGANDLNGALSAQHALFLGNSSTSDATAYYKHVEYRMECDECLKSQRQMPKPAPDASVGDRYWLLHFANRPSPTLSEKPHRRDLRDIATQVLRENMPGATLDLIRGRGRSRKIAVVRREIALMSSQLGYSGTAIANFLCISQSRVSQLTAATAWAPAPLVGFRGQEIR